MIMNKIQGSRKKDNGQEILSKEQKVSKSIHRKFNIRISKYKSNILLGLDHMI